MPADTECLVVSGARAKPVQILSSAAHVSEMCVVRVNERDEAVADGDQVGIGVRICHAG
jgi:hypothetical protein